jgi:hypothetical protein
MNYVRAHLLPTYSESARDDALFHYTSASGLIGIIESKTLWSTAYYCANDEQELAAERGVLAELFRSYIQELERKGDARIQIFYKRGIDPFEYAHSLENLIINLALSSFIPYITCFCRTNLENDYLHGLLSQWRGYGQDGGYALQFSRGKLNKFLAEINSVYCDLYDVSYERQSNFFETMLEQRDAFLQAFDEQLKLLALPMDFRNREWENPLLKLPNGALESLMNFLIYRKNEHFSEERECRMSVVLPTRSDEVARAVKFFNRNGLLVPYVAITAEKSNILSALEWIIIGPGPRLNARFDSVTSLVQQHNLEAKIRVSQIPFTRL